MFSDEIQDILTRLSLSSSLIDYSNFTSFDRTFRNYCGESRLQLYQPRFFESKKKLSSVPTKQDLNQSPQLQRLARKIKFILQQVEL